MSPERPESGLVGSGDEPDGGKTSPSLLDRVRDWADHPAWADFHRRYDPMLRRWCGRYTLDADAADELCQRIWIELMARMRTFRYDPGGGFRKWLWHLFHSRAIDFLRRRRAATTAPYADLSIEALAHLPDRDEGDPGAESAPFSPALSIQAEAAQVAVRARVDALTWRAYWMVAIEDRPIREVAESLGKSYTAVYTGYKRVDRMLRAEGERRLSAMLDASS